MSAREFSEWLAYWKLEPWGSWRDNWHSANLTALLFNIHRGKRSAMKPKDFMYEDRVVSVQRMAKTFSAKMRALVEGQKNGKPG